MLSSDGDIRAEIARGRVVLEPSSEQMIQPSSVDVRLYRFFRVLENYRCPHIDLAENQPDLTRPVEPEGEEPFIVHPGESALEGTYSLGRLGLLTHPPPSLSILASPVTCRWS